MNKPEGEDMNQKTAPVTSLAPLPPANTVWPPAGLVITTAVALAVI